MKRKAGWYRVKLKTDIKWYRKAGEYAYALWIGESWLLLGAEYWDEDFEEIDETHLSD